MPDLKAVQRPISKLPVTAKLSIPGSPDWVGIAPDAVWISNATKNSISRIDPASNKIVATVPVSEAPCSGLAVGFGSVWVPSCGDARIDRVDAATNKVVAQIPTPVGDSEGGIAAGEGGVWMVADEAGTLLHIDPARNAIAARIKTAPGSFVPAVGAGSVWVTSTQGNSVARVDPRSHQVLAQIKVGLEPRFIAIGEGSVWTLNQGDGTVSRIDPNTNRMVATIEVGKKEHRDGGDISVGNGFVWVTAKNVPLTQIDPATNSVRVQFVGKGGDALRVGRDAVWLCSFILEEVWRVPLPLP